MIEPFSTDAGRNLLPLSGAGRGTPGIPPAPPPPSRPFGLGLSLRDCYLPLHADHPTTFAYDVAVGTAQTYFPLWGSKLRCILGRTHAEMTALGTAAAAAGVPYDCLGYNLESSGDPDELADVVQACKDAEIIAASFSKPLLIGPGGRLADEHAAEVPSMAACADYWLLQGQRQQIYAPGAGFEDGIRSRLDLVLSGNPTITLLVQISTWAGYLLTAAQLYAYIAALAGITPTYTLHAVNLYDGHDPAPPAIVHGALDLFYAGAAHALDFVGPANSQYAGVI